jgi:hypothetical protein
MSLISRGRERTGELEDVMAVALEDITVVELEDMIAYLATPQAHFQLWMDVFEVRKKGRGGTS